MNNSVIYAISGSLRKESLNTKILQVAAQAISQGGAVKVEEISLLQLNLPLYNGDLEAAEGLPLQLLELKPRLNASLGYLFASPEYNGSYTAALKNFIDWVSRPAPEEKGQLLAFRHKAAAIISASPGSNGGIRGLISLRALLGGIKLHVLPEQYAAGGLKQASFYTGENGLLRLKSEQQEKALQQVSLALRNFALQQKQT